MLHLERERKEKRKRDGVIIRLRNFRVFCLKKFRNLGLIMDINFEGSIVDSLLILYFFADDTLIPLVLLKIKIFLNILQSYHIKIIFFCNKNGSYFQCDSFFEIQIT